MKKDIMSMINEKIIEELQDEIVFLKDLVENLFKEIGTLNQQLAQEMEINDMVAKMQEEELEIKNEVISELKKELNKVEVLMMIQHKK